MNNFRRSTPNLGEYSVGVTASGTGYLGWIFSHVLPHEDVVVALDAPTDLSALASSPGRGGFELGR